MLRGYPGLQPRDPGSVQLSLSDGKFKIPLPLRAGVTSTRRIAVYRFSKSDLKASPFSVNKDGYNAASFYSRIDGALPFERFGKEELKTSVGVVTDKARPAVYAGLYGFDETPAKDEMGDGFDNLITGNLTSAPAYDEFWGYLRLATNVMAHGFWQERHSEYSYRRAGAEDAYFFSAQRSFESGDKGEALAYVLHGLIASGWSPIGGVGEALARTILLDLDERYRSGGTVFHANAYTESSGTIDMQVTVEGADFVHVYDVKFLALQTTRWPGGEVYAGFKVSERGSLDDARAANHEYFLLVLSWVATL
mmetsp:Transcript_8280/g.24752  ORF Transcript_8280/g.24752 Transcript_8280/m.24752 type:complete len:308 (-) Transcript_8280:29-952(-)